MNHEIDENQECTKLEDGRYGSTKISWNMKSWDKMHETKNNSWNVWAARNISENLKHEELCESWRSRVNISEMNMNNSDKCDKCMKNPKNGW